MQPPSAIEHARIENAAHGIVLEDLCAPSLEGIEFVNIAEDRHIFLKSDGVLPYGYWTGTPCQELSFVVSPVRWDLGGGTHVVASTTEFNDATWIGTSGKNDLIVYGKLFTDGSSAGGDMVYFEPDSITPLGEGTAGADWGGVLLGSTAAGSLLRWADIGYAENPLFLAYPDSLTKVEDSRVHTFADVGIWVQGSKGQGGVINRCVVDRNASLVDSLGGVGIYLDRADELDLLNTQVLLRGRDAESGATGISIRYGKTFCQTTPPSARSLLLWNNFVIGPGRGGLTYGEAYSGIQTNWVCGSTNRDVDLLSNWVSKWKLAGMEFVQTADVQVGCNVVVDNNRGADIYRDSEPTGSAIRFKDNKLEVTQPDEAFFALRTNDAVKTKLGPASAGNRGTNRLKVNQSLTKFIIENDPTAADTLHAQDNFWYADTLFTSYPADSVKINARLAPTRHSVAYDPFLTDDTALPTCWPDTSGQGLPQMLAQRGQGVDPERAAALYAPFAGEPTVLELGRPFPNPNRSGAVIMLAVPRDAVGTYKAEVFDVRGRKIRGLRQDVVQPGRYRVEWDGRDGEGRTAAAGIYFLRLSGPRGFVQVRKLTVLR